MSPTCQPLLSSLFFTCLRGGGGGRERRPASWEGGGGSGGRGASTPPLGHAHRGPPRTLTRGRAGRRAKGGISRRRARRCTHRPCGEAQWASSNSGARTNKAESRRQHRREESMAACAIPHSVICADTAGLAIVASWDTTSGESGKREGTDATSPPPLSATSTCRGTSPCALLGFWASSGFLSTARWTSNFSSVMASQPTPHLAHTSSSSFAHASSEPLYVSSLLPPQPPHCPSPCRR